MRVLRPIVAVALVLYLGAAPLGNVVFAQQAQEASVVTSADLNRALAERVEQRQDERQQILSVLQRDDVRGIAAGIGFDLRDAESAVHTLQGDGLTMAASHAEAIDEALSGGTVIQISLVAALLIVIIVILLAD